MTAGIVVNHDGPVLRVRINRPEQRGALDMPTVDALIDTFEGAGIDDTVRVVHLKGSGDDFCAGADVVAANRGDASAKPRPGRLQRRTALQAHRLVALMVETQLPVVCTVRGWAAGLGCQLALAADFTVAADDARFWEPYTVRGFTPDSGASWLVPRLIGLSRAKEFLVLGRVVTGAEAAEWGMIHRAVPEVEVDAVADELIDRLASSATVAVGLAKRLLHTATVGTLTDAMADEALALELAARTADFREGIAAFAEHRDPNYRGQ